MSGPFGFRIAAAESVFSARLLALSTTHLSFPQVATTVGRLGLTTTSLNLAEILIKLYQYLHEDRLQQPRYFEAVQCIPLFTAVCGDSLDRLTWRHLSRPTDDCRPSTGQRRHGKGGMEVCAMHTAQSGKHMGRHGQRQGPNPTSRPNRADPWLRVERSPAQLTPSGLLSAHPPPACVWSGSNEATLQHHARAQTPATHTPSYLRSTH